ncbi:MAG: hypothetical protein ACRDK9_07075 [Solirubrobacterales bacterium]
MRLRPSLVVVLVASIASGSVAFGHTPEQKYSYFKWRISGDPYEHCAVALARTAHGNYGHGFARADTYSVHIDPVYGSACSFPSNQAPGDIKARFTWKRKTNGVWAFCDNSNVQHNTTRTWKLETYRNYARATCNKGFYQTFGYHGVRAKGQWRENGSYSGEHYFE